MADFRARILAELDASRIQGDLDRIGQNHTLTLSNLAVDQNGINNVIRQIQRSLDNHQFNININLPNIQRQTQQAGNNAGNNFANGIRQGISNVVNNTRDEIQRMRDTLANMNFDVGSIDVVTRDLDQMNLAINRIVTNINRNGDVRITVRGIDEFGDAVTQIRQFENDSGQIRNLGRTIAQSFDTGEAAARAFREEVNVAYTDMVNMSKKIVSLTQKRAGLDSVNDTDEIQLINKQISEYSEQYNKLMSAYGNSFSKTQTANLQRIFDGSRNSLALLNKEIQKAERIEKVNSDFEELYSIAKKLNSTKIDIAKLDTTKNAEEIKVLEDALTSLRKSYAKLHLSLKQDLSSEQTDTLNKVFSDAKNQIDRINAKTADATGKLASTAQISNLDNKIALWLSKNSKASKDFGASLETLRGRLKEMGNSGNALVSDLKDVEQEFKDITTQAALAGKTGKSFAISFQDAFQRITQYITIDRLFDYSIEAMRGMAQNVYDIDTAMTGLKKVTDETSDRYNQFLETSAESAKELKRSISGLVEQSAEWAKLGYSINEAEELAKISSVYANVADIDDTTAVSDMVTAMKSFNITSSEAITIVDRLNALSNDFAVSAAGLGQGLSRSASTMATAGTDISKTLALLTGISEITQSPEEAGNFLKTSVARLQGKPFKCPLVVKTTGTYLVKYNVA